MGTNRLLFASIHSYLDPSSGAAMASRELLELLTVRGWDCRVLACGVLDYQRETPLEEALATMELPAARAAAGLSRCGSAEVFDLEVGGVRVTLMPTSSSRAEKSPNPREGAIFLDLADQVCERFQPQVLLTYGGHPVSLELMRRARARGIAVVFHLHNFGYNDRRGFENVSAIIFPSEYSRRFHQRRLGLDGVVIPDPIRLDHVIAENPEPTYVTLINPQPDKGVTVFGRIALELNERRPEIPLLIVEGRGTSEVLAKLPVDLSGLANLNRMGNTPDPRDFYLVSRAVLMPSLWRESLGRVAIEAMANGIPVLASDRAPCPRRWATRASFSRSPSAARRPAASCRRPARSLPGSRRSSGCGTTRSLRPGIAQARAEARRWDWDSVAEMYQRFFEGVGRSARCEGR